MIYGDDYDDDEDDDDYEDYLDNWYMEDEFVTPFGKLRNMIRSTYFLVKRNIIHRFCYTFSKHYREHWDDIPF